MPATKINIHRYVDLISLSGPTFLASQGSLEYIVPIEATNANLTEM